MSGPVDVLAVMDAEIAALPQMASMASVHGVECDPEEAVRRMTEARAAVVEMIEALEQAFDFPPDFFDRPDDELEQITVSGRHLRMVRAALARCRGEA